MPTRTRWKIVESSSVTDDALEGIVNELTGAGWVFEGIQFAMRESSKRPAMAFVMFTRAQAEPEPAGKSNADGDQRGPSGAGAAGDGRG